ncbi:hypothetical protein D3C85_1762450 [compost metagenome]
MAPNSSEVNRYHCCATCKCIQIGRDGAGRAKAVCTRLGYSTHPKYQFDCWDPRQAIVDKMEEESNKRTSGVLSKRSTL